MLRLVLVLAMAAAAYGTNVQQCAGGEPMPLATLVQGCNEIPCRLPQLQDAVINLVFAAPRALDSMRTVATVYLRLGALTLPVAYDLGSAADTCANLVGGCPVPAGRIVLHSLQIPILHVFPVGVTYDVELKVVDDNNAAVACARVPTQITAPLPTSAAVRVVENL